MSATDILQHISKTRRKVESTAASPVSYLQVEDYTLFEDGDAVRIRNRPTNQIHDAVVVGTPKHWKIHINPPLPTSWNGALALPEGSDVYQDLPGGAGGGGPAATPDSLVSLTDTDVGPPYGAGQSLIWDATSGKWKNQMPPAPATPTLALADLTDVGGTAAAAGMYLVYHGAAGAARWEATAEPVIPTNIADLGDVNPTAAGPLADGQVLTWNTDHFEGKTHPSGATTLGALNDVDVTGAAAAAVLTYRAAAGGNPAGWVAAAPGAAGAVSLNDLSDADTATNPPINGQFLAWDQVNRRWKPKTEVETLALCSDVEIAVPAQNNVLTYNAALQKWINVPQPTPSLALNDLSDVTISAAIKNQSVLYYVKGMGWIGTQLVLTMLGNVSNTRPTDGQMLEYQTASGEWTPVTYNLDALANVAPATAMPPANGNVLSYNAANTRWEPSAGPAGTVAGLSDVELAALRSDEFLVYNATDKKWHNRDRVAAMPQITLQPTGQTGNLGLADVVDSPIVTPAAGMVLTYHGAAGGDPARWEPTAPASIPGVIDDLTNVNSTAAGPLADGAVLTWKTDHWEAQTHSSGATTLGALNDVDVTGAAAGSVLTYQAAAGGTQAGWVAAAGGAGGAIGINSLTDVDTATTAPTDGQFLSWNQAQRRWLPKTESESLEQLSDVTITTPANGHFLQWSAAANAGAGGWINSGAAVQVALGGLSDVHLPAGDAATRPNNAQLLWDGRHKRWFADALTFEELSDVYAPQGIQNEGWVITFDTATDKFTLKPPVGGGGAGGAVVNIGDLADVRKVAPASGDYFRWNARKAHWEPHKPLLSHSEDVNTYDNVPRDGDLLTWSANNRYWMPVAPGNPVPEPPAPPVPLVEMTDADRILVQRSSDEEKGYVTLAQLKTMLGC